MDELKNQDERKSLLFKSIFGCLILCDDYKIAGQIIQQLFMVIRSKYCSVDCLAALQQLRVLCETHTLVTSDTSKVDEAKKDALYSTFDYVKDGDSYKETTSYA